MMESTSQSAIEILRAEEKRDFFVEPDGPPG